MPDSSYLTKVVEPYVVRWVSDRIGVKLSPKRVRVGTRADGVPVHFEFDGVSEDERVGLLVSASRTVNPGGRLKLHVDASVLLNAPFQRRLMGFVSDDVRQTFLNKGDCLLPLSGIEMLVCDSLPVEMRGRITEPDEGKSRGRGQGQESEAGRAEAIAPPTQRPVFTAAPCSTGRKVFE